MKLRTLLLILVLTMVAVFTVFNWEAFNAPTSLSFGVITFQAPLGLVMLGLCVFLIAFFLVFTLFMQTGVLLDARQQAKEIRANRDLADKAEASRFTELRIFLEQELAKMAASNLDAKAALQAQLAHLERELRSSIELTGNTLAAHIGEFEDRFERESDAKKA